MTIGVLVELSNKNLDKEFYYSVPFELESRIKIGIRVVVPFASRELDGFVLEINPDTDYNELKEIKSILDDEVVLNNELLELGIKMKNKYLSTLISNYNVMLPKALKANIKNKSNIKYEKIYKLNNIDFSNFKFNDKQKEIIDYLKKNSFIVQNSVMPFSKSSISTLLNKNILICENREVYRLKYDKVEGVNHKLTSDQQNVVDSINLSSFDTYLLYGVTGSGKTEVYMELIAHVIESGKSAIMLVPEISLTPQMINRFSSRFGSSIAALHSGLSDGEKYDEYRKIEKEEAKIVIGARSAVFAPLKNIGIIIVDEEHSDSYKQDSPSPRYSAIDIANIRCETYNCPLVLGSATPTLDSMARAVKGVYKLLVLDKRVNNHPLPPVRVIDMNKAIRTSVGHFSVDLINEMKSAFGRGEQVILFLNRRGYSSIVSCKNCGETIKCPNCDISLTYHKSSNILRCHYCGYATNFNIKCSKCGENSMSKLGVGTEKIEEELKSLFPNNKVIRMDYDTTTRKGSVSKIISSFRKKEYDILLGTQIVAKGLDFDNVTLVGIINADTSLNIPDFRASENTFQLLSQVAGRAGRSYKQGKVILQTYNPDHYSIMFAKEQNYIGFFNEEMKIRYKLKYPPYTYICYINISSSDEKLLEKEANIIKDNLSLFLKDEIILGPSPNRLYKLNNIFRLGIIIKYKKDDNLYKILIKIIDHYKSNNKIRVDVNFSPSHF